MKSDMGYLGVKETLFSLIFRNSRQVTLCLLNFQKIPHLRLTAMLALILAVPLGFLATHL